MDICDFVACRIFSENGLWQWDEKPGYAAPLIDQEVLFLMAS